MRLKFWGTRGSIATPGPETVRYGGNTTSLEINFEDGTLLIIDAGTGIWRLGNTLRKIKKIPPINLFLTHSHWDHIQGFPFFAPIYNPKAEINIIGCQPAQDKLKQIVSGQMESTYFPVDFNDLKARINFENICKDEYLLGNAKLSLIEANHPGVNYGVKIEENQKRMVFLTDNELETYPVPKTSWEEFVEFVRGADLLIHDAQYTEEEIKEKRGWGHSYYRYALKLALEAEVKTLILFHHDPEHSDYEIDRIVEECRETIAEKNAPLVLFAAVEGDEITL